MLMYLFERERAREHLSRGEGRQREREGMNPKHTSPEHGV